MNTPSKAYVTKFSSGILLTLLAFSGLLFIVPSAIPVFAANASAGSASSNVTVFKSAASTAGVTFSFSNPASNQFSQNQFEVIFPGSGWSATVASCSGVGLAGITFTYAAGSVLATSFTLPPGSTGSVTCTIVSPALVSTTSAPDTGTFTYKTSDTSSGALVTASTQTVYVTGATSFTFVTSPAVTTTLTAGQTVTITFTAAGSTKGIAGLPVAFTFAAPGPCPGPNYNCSGLATLTATATTDSSGNAVASFFPDPVIAEQGAGGTTVTATAGGNAGIAGTTGSIKVTTAAAASTLSIAIGGVSPPTKITKTTLAAIGAATIVVSSTDTYGNPAVVSATSATSVTLTAVNLVGSRAGFSAGAYAPPYPYVPTGGSAPVQTSSASIPAAGTSGPAALGYIYDVDYLDESYIVASASSLSSGSSSHIITLTLATTAGTITPGPAAVTVAAGKTQTITFVLPAASVQAGVPVIFNITSAFSPPGFTACASISCYKGGFSGANFVKATTDSTGTATATLTVDTRLGYAAIVKAQYALSPSAYSAVVEPATGQIQTISGSPSTLTVLAFFDSVTPSVAPVKSGQNAVNGTTLYVDVQISDKYGNIASNPGPGQIGVNLALNPASPAGGTLSTTFAIIPLGGSHTNCAPTPGCSGFIAWALPATIGTSITLTATGFTLTPGTFTIKTNSAKPSFTVTSPKPLSGVIYSSSVAVVLSGYANTSSGFATTGPNAVTMSKLNYRVGSGTWHFITLANSNPTWSFAATMSAGLNSLTINVTDTNGDVSVPQTFTVLVDTAAPVVTFTTANGATINFTNSVTATIVVAQGDLNATSVVATVNGTALASSAVTVTGANNNGHSVTYTVTLKGLPAGHDNLGLSAKTLAGLTGSASSITVKVQVSFAQSVIINSASYGTLGSFNGVSVSATNIWSSSQNLVVFAVWKNSAGQTVAVTTGGLTLGSGGTGSTFSPLASGLPSGSYSVSVFVITTSNNPVSSPTSITVSV